MGFVEVRRHGELVELAANRGNHHVSDSEFDFGMGRVQIPVGHDRLLGCALNEPRAGRAGLRLIVLAPRPGRESGPYLPWVARMRTLGAEIRSSRRTALIEIGA